MANVTYILWFVFNIWGQVTIKASSYQNRDSHYKDETALWPSDLYNGNSYAGKANTLVNKLLRIRYVKQM